MALADVFEKKRKRPNDLNIIQGSAPLPRQPQPMPPDSVGTDVIPAPDDSQDEAPVFPKNDSGTKQVVLVIESDNAKLLGEIHDVAQEIIRDYGPDVIKKFYYQ